MLAVSICAAFTPSGAICATARDRRDLRDLPPFEALASPFLRHSEPFFSRTKRVVAGGVSPGRNGATVVPTKLRCGRKDGTQSQTARKRQHRLQPLAAAKGVDVSRVDWKVVMAHKKKHGKGFETHVPHLMHHVVG